MCFEIKDVTSLERQTNTPAIEIKAQEKVTKTREEWKKKDLSLEDKYILVWLSLKFNHNKYHLKVHVIIYLSKPGLHPHPLFLQQLNHVKIIIPFPSPPLSLSPSSYPHPSPNHFSANYKVLFLFSFAEVRQYTCLYRSDTIHKQWTILTFSPPPLLLSPFYVFSFGRSDTVHWSL